MSWFAVTVIFPLKKRFDHLASTVSSYMYVVYPGFLRLVYGIFGQDFTSISSWSNSPPMLSVDGAWDLSLTLGGVAPALSVTSVMVSNDCASLCCYLAL